MGQRATVIAEGNRVLLLAKVKAKVKAKVTAEAKATTLQSSSEAGVFSYCMFYCFECKILRSLTNHVTCAPTAKSTPWGRHIVTRGRRIVRYSQLTYSDVQLTSVDVNLTLVNLT